MKIKFYFIAISFYFLLTGFVEFWYTESYEPDEVVGNYWEHNEH